MNLYVKSALYLTGFSALSWVLLEVTEPSKEKLAEIKRQRGITATEDTTSQKALLMKTLKEASESKDPIYLKKSKNE